jgi:thiol:disulfide interchange protein DsbD
MQFQNAPFLVVLTLLVTLVAMNLFGVFEVNLGAGAMGVAGELASKQGATGAFFNGILATALATPCTAPFLGVALGFAFAQSPAIIVLMFSMVALGLAAPYVILSWRPGWLKFLPKPGVWMEKFKVAMGFPMLATAIWLFSLTIPHFGKEDAFWLGLFLVLLALAAWVWGEFVQRGTRRKTLALVISVLLVSVSYGYVLEGKLDWRSPRRPLASTGGVADPGGISWTPWSAQAVQEARAEGRPVFVDFTADWCVTCQVNKKSSIEIPSVRAKLKEINAVPLLGDYTLEDEKIGAELKRFHRAGVPLVVVYPKNPKAPAIVLPEFLTPTIVLKALDKAAR